MAIKVAVGILRKDNKILLCRRRNNVHYPLKWEFPGGKIENGETPEECLRRELKEELSIDARIGEEYHVQNVLYPDSGAYEVRYFLVTTFDSEIENRAFSEIRWVLIGKLAGYDVLEGNREVVRKIIGGDAA